MTKDVEWDLINKIYESASVRYFDRDVGIVDRPIDNEKFKVETYIQAAFTPNDGSPTQYEYVKAISFINTNKDKWMYYALLIGALLLVFAPVILLLRGA